MTDKQRIIQAIAVDPLAPEVENYEWYQRVLPKDQQRVVEYISVESLEEVPLDPKEPWKGTQKVGSQIHVAVSDTWYGTMHSSGRKWRAGYNEQYRIGVVWLEPKQLPTKQ